MEGSVLTVFSLSRTAPVESAALGGLWSVWHEAHIRLSRFQQDVRKRAIPGGQQQGRRLRRCRQPRSGCRGGLGHPLSLLRETAYLPCRRTIVSVRWIIESATTDLIADGGCDPDDTARWPASANGWSGVLSDPQPAAQAPELIDKILPAVSQLPDQQDHRRTRHGET